jgi:hypothetical protein
MPTNKSTKYYPNCHWCNKAYDKAKAVYPKGLMSFIGGEMGFSKAFCPISA